MRETVFGHMQTFVQSDQDLHCPLTESLATTECMNGEQTPGWNIAQDDLNLHILRMFEGTFSLDAIHVIRTLLNM